jgi:formylglycine-generating enzyme required for sulfatase activity
MVYVPEGLFSMGDSFGEGDLLERPVHKVWVSSFLMDTHEVTKTVWGEVYDWARTKGYSFKNAGSGKGPDHPVHRVSWYDCVKWCNARSEKEGLQPVYYTSDRTVDRKRVYRIGDVELQNQWVDWMGNGYRLPTEAEWEYAARGGAAGRRFPWSDVDTIDHSRANYWSSGLDYDKSPTRGLHPLFQTREAPRTSPVGSFAPNGYGLYDMAGNVWEWCWDWHDSAYGPEARYFKIGNNAGQGYRDPHGPTTGSHRVHRGGAWRGDSAEICNCRVALRGESYPYTASNDMGFRTVRRALAEPAGL